MGTSVKCYMGDTGLLVSMAFSECDIAEGNPYKQVMDGKLSLNEGMFHENAIAQALVAQGRDLYFYTRYSEEKHRNDIEVDFLVSDGSAMRQRVVPVEVKSSKNYTNVSYDRLKGRFEGKVGGSLIVRSKAFRVDADG